MRFLKIIQNRILNIKTSNESKYSRMDQVKFVEDNL